MPNVMIFKETILPPSETFILAQMRLLQRYIPFLVGLEPASKSLPLESKPLLLSPRPTRLANLRSKIYRRTGVAPIFHERAKALGVGLIHAHFAGGGKATLPLKRHLGVPLVVTLHGGLDVPVDKERLGIFRNVGEEADVLICVSEFIRKLAIEAGFPPEKLVVHYIGIDRSCFYPSAPPAENEDILFVGRLVEKKGCEYLLRAMQSVQSTCPDSKLIIVGDGPLRSHLAAVAKELSVKCEFLGYQPSTVIRELLRKVRLFCLPSVTPPDGNCEGLPIALVEAQSMGIPAVTTQHSGNPEGVLDGKTGLVVPERDSERLSAAILQLLKDRDFWTQCHQSTQPHIEEHFNLSTQTAKLEAIYDRAVANR